MSRAAALVLCVFGLSACGGEEPARPRGSIVYITLDDFRIKPQDIRLGAGEYTFKVFNAGRLPHNFKVRAGEQTRVGFSTLLPRRGEAKLRRISRGGYKIVCTIANHEELGMYGTLTVR